MNTKIKYEDSKLVSAHEIDYGSFFIVPETGKLYMLLRETNLRTIDNSQFWVADVERGEVATLSVVGDLMVEPIAEMIIRPFKFD